MAHNPVSVETIAPHDDQNVRYWITIISFLVLSGLAMLVLYVRDGEIPQTIEPYHIIILSLACFRLIRLFTYDQIMRAVRDLFVEKREVVDEHGQHFIVRRKVQTGGRRSLADLFSCPWCMGMWVSFFTVFFYFAFPMLRYFALVLAIAGIGSMLQIFMNMVGAKAEFYKHENNIHN